MVGTYDGSNWKLFRNGTQVASVADPVGALRVDNGDWASGSTGEGWADYFSGTIDAVAIYGQALTAAKVQAHYAAASSAAPPNPTLSISLAGGKVTITWSARRLQQADTITDPFTDVPGAASPQVISPTGATKFYKVRQ